MSKKLEARLLPRVVGIGEMLKVSDQKRKRAEEQETQTNYCNCLNSKKEENSSLIERAQLRSLHTSDYVNSSDGKVYKLLQASSIRKPGAKLNRSIEQESCNFALLRLMALRASNKSDTLSSNLSLRSAYDRADIAEISDNQLEAISSHTFENGSENSRIPTKIYGPDSLQTSIRVLLNKYINIFSSTVRSEPASVEPFELLVDKTLWEVPANRLGARKMDKVKAYELRKQIQKLKEIGVIRPSEQGHYSNGFVVLVIDFKNLNKVS